MMRILQMGMTDNLGGIETYLINYYREIDKKNIQFDFTNIYPNKLCFQDELENNGAKIYKVPNYYKQPLKYIKSVKKIIKNNNYDIVHCNMNSAVMLFPLITAKIAGAKVIIAHSHNNSNDKGFLKSLLHNINKHFIPLLATDYFSCSKEAGEWFYNKKILESDKFRIIKNPIKSEKFVYDECIRLKVRKELKISNDTFVIGHVGRFAPQKNHSFLIDIFNEVIKNNFNSKLLLVGVGDLQDSIKEKVKQMKLEDHVIFLNNRDDVNEIMQAMDVFVFPSLYEGLGIVLVEAQASGLPVVTTTEIPNIVNISKNYRTLSLKRSVAEWANEILSLKDINRLKLSHNPFDVQDCVIELTKIYNDIRKL